MRGDGTSGRLWRAVVSLLAVAGVGSACASSSQDRRPITREEFFEFVVGHGFTGVSGSNFGFSADPPMLGGYDGCNHNSGALEFSNGEVVFPAEGMVGTDRLCEGLPTDGFGWVFGLWLVESDGSLVVIAARDGSEHAVPDITIPDP